MLVLIKSGFGKVSREKGMVGGQNKNPFYCLYGRVLQFNGPRKIPIYADPMKRNLSVSDSTFSKSYNYSEQKD